MALTDTKIRGAKPQSKPYKLYDGHGLFLLINPNGSKLWRFRYRFNGKQNALALGAYPSISLKEARFRANDARKLLSDGTNPSLARKARKAAQGAQTENCFEAIAREWIARFSPSWSVAYTEAVRRRLERNAFPWLGATLVSKVTAPQVLAALRRIESRGALETAHMVKQYCGQIFRYSIATGRCERDPAADLRGALPSPKPKHFASITDPKEIGGLLRAIDSYSGSHVVRCALKLAPLVFRSSRRATAW